MAQDRRRVSHSPTHARILRVRAVHCPCIYLPYATSHGPPSAGSCTACMLSHALGCGRCTPRPGRRQRWRACSCSGSFRAHFDTCYVPGTARSCDFSRRRCNSPSCSPMWCWRIFSRRLPKFWAMCGSPLCCWPTLSWASVQMTASCFKLRRMWPCPCSSACRT